MFVSKITTLTEFKVLQGVNLDPSYTDSMTYASAEARDSYFAGKAKYSYYNLVPVRDNTIRLPIPVDNVFNCGYVMYKNANFNNKWFYGFIIQKSWVNANCCEIVIEIDVLTTWLFDWTLHHSYVVRQHVSNDTIGRNIEPEPTINTALKIKNVREDTVLSTETGVGAIIWYMPKDGKVPGNAANKYNSGNVFCACNHVYYRYESWEKMYDEIIAPLAEDGLLDNIIAIQMVPAKFQQEGSGTGNDETYYIQDTVNLTKFHDLDGYTPANKKLLTFPYNSMIVSSGDGEQQEFAIEHFHPSDDTPNQIHFNIYCTMSIAPVIVCEPLEYGYHSISNNSIPAYKKHCPSQMSTAKNFPLGFFSGLSGLGYVQNVISNLMNTTRDYWVNEESHPLDQAVGRGIGLLSEKMAIPFTNIGVSAQGTRQGGQLPSGTTLYNLCFANFYYTQSCIPAQTAEWADKMLTRWGYMINSVNNVNINGRERFNYIQTKDLIITGDIPNEDLDKIKKIFEGGVTFWHQERGHEIGDWNGNANGNPII